MIFDRYQFIFLGGVVLLSGTAIMLFHNLHKQMTYFTIQHDDFLRGKVAVINMIYFTIFCYNFVVGVCVTVIGICIQSCYCINKTYFILFRRLCL